MRNYEATMGVMVSERALREALKRAVVFTAQRS